MDCNQEAWGRVPVRGAAHENGVLCPKDTALGAASVLEGLLANIALCPATPEIRHLLLQAPGVLCKLLTHREMLSDVRNNNRVPFPCSQDFL